MNYLILLSAFIFNTYFPPPETVDLTIVVSNVTTLEGNIKLGVFQDSKTFLKSGKEHSAYSKKATNETVIFYLKGLKKANMPFLSFMTLTPMIDVT